MYVYACASVCVFICYCTNVAFNYNENPVFQRCKLALPQASVATKSLLTFEHVSL